MLSPKQVVLKKYPHAYVEREGVKVHIRRPRTEDDLPALVGYVMMSSVWYTEEDAWREVAKGL